VMKLGIEDYLVKDEISTPVLPKTILSVIERKALRDRLTTWRSRRNGSRRYRRSFARSRRRSDFRLTVKEGNGRTCGHAPIGFLEPVLTIIRDNLDRIEKKIVQLKDLKTDKTITYIKNIRMFDLSVPDRSSS